MAKIHYVWWGNPPTDNADLTGKAKDTPNDLAALVGTDHEIHYWRQAGPFNPVLHHSIIQHQIDDPYELVADTLWSAGNGIRFHNVLKSLAAYRAFAAVKDLLSYAIMMKHGGFFFDTTTRVLDYGRDALRRALAAPPDGPRVPMYPMTGGAQGKVMRPDDETIDYTMTYPVAVVPDARTVQIPNFDVWTLYSPPGDVLFGTAFNSYLNRAQNFGLDKHPGTNRVFNKSIDEVMTQDDKGSRNFIIAGLSTTSIAQGLHTKAKQANRAVTDFGWMAVKKDGTNRDTVFADGGTVYLPDAGIHKVFGGSWR